MCTELTLDVIQERVRVFVCAAHLLRRTQLIAVNTWKSIKSWHRSLSEFWDSPAEDGDVREQLRALYRPAPTACAELAHAQGRAIPLVGLGTWKTEPGQLQRATEVALRLGYRVCMLPPCVAACWSRFFA